ncbi:prephenate dehydrogenase/arogenate dehydrogenase family protein [Desulfobaculum bizertense]|uniref:Prephenate dehydrogenase n=2 Tax=Pseudomonadati TaxID=3379134 RepID=A0A1T4WTW0_9BACT|nr:prephenate dehydrogenase/arogenate dehydrogenase family protein [Desulfobaculum bizertense]SKA80547.1 prephenate dehydrogenase [Desulfobaculum bizertense DSM 18034]
MTAEKQIQRVLIVGSTGKMGRLFMQRAQEAGLEVRGVDRPLTPESVAEAAQGVDLVLLAVPASAMSKVSALCASVMQAPQILADVCSVKVNPVKSMMRLYDGPVVGTHPLFGPNPAEGEVSTAITPGRDDNASHMVLDFFLAMGFSAFMCSAEEHDQAMASIQGLNFVTTVSYFAALAHKPELDRFITPSFTRRLNAARKMLTQDAELFAGFIEENPFTQDAVKSFRSMLNIAAGGDIELLAERANWWWRDNNKGGGV